MFKSLKVYVRQEIAPLRLASFLADFGYRRQDRVLEEGDFSCRGEVLDVYPATFECPVRISFDFEKIVSIASVDIAANRALASHDLLIILPSHKTYRSRLTNFNEKLPLSLFVELKKGDYVVHVQHGIGKYLGREKLETSPGHIRDTFVVEYANKEKLYVSAPDAHLIQKFIGLKGRPPKVNRLGTREWQTIKNRVRNAIVSVALGLLKIQAARLASAGYAFSKDTAWQSEFEKSFPYPETPDQDKAITEVKKDMEASYSMDRLLCGDVGYGKTEVALRAAFKSVMDNKQVALLVPTTILAQQHYQNFIRRLMDFPVNVQVISRFKTAGQQKRIIEDIKNGKVDVVIGTHRLLSDDIAFRDLGLLIIDEEQRFGVRAKEKIKSLRLNLDILTLTATPIPRTLYMGLMGIKDISAINTPPEDRIAVATYVLEYDEEVIRHALQRELSRKGQVFFVHNQVYDIINTWEKVKSLAPESANVVYAHGQMPEHKLENIMGEFLDKKIDCLVSTTIIESGIDAPLANTIIVNNAHTFGLSDLHQLRGRVGRLNRKAYAYFLIPRDEAINPQARSRLEAIKEYSQLGSGFRIAMEDLEIRGAGNLLGYEQHGYIQAVGFDLYCRLLKEAVALLQQPAPG